MAGPPRAARYCEGAHPGSELRVRVDLGKLLPVARADEAPDRPGRMPIAEYEKAATHLFTKTRKCRVDGRALETGSGNG
ncbi:hypothetical protein GCM10027079_26290 [Sediminivirga luteola]|uniref:Uncharacterized protein n=1 Tax=Sediminivirga luteola TaxID=1774748 RepID=A0A8J2U0K5_9MICO|nr:hypothetical protein GCM10011333_30020 [Sediminivirga luteola]